MAVAEFHFDWKTLGFTKLQLVPQSEDDTSDNEISAPKEGQDLHLLSRIEHPRYHLLHGIILDIETDENGEKIASNSYLNLYGVGETTEEAIDEFSSMLVDLYEELENSEEVLSSYLGKQLNNLRDILAVR